MKKRYAILGTAVAAVMACGTVTPALAAPAPILEVASVSADATTQGPVIAGTPVTTNAKPGTAATVPVSFVNNSGDKIAGTGQVVFTAPQGVTFTNQSKVAASWTKAGGTTWASWASPELTVVSISPDGRTMTGSFDFKTDSWYSGNELRWTPSVAVDKSVPTSTLSISAQATFGAGSAVASVPLAVTADITASRAGSVAAMAGTTVDAPIAFSNTSGANLPAGKLEFTAPAGVRFAADQKRVPLDYRAAGSTGAYTAWSGAECMVDSISADGRTMICSAPFPGGSWKNGNEFRWTPKVTIDRSAASGPATVTASATFGTATASNTFRIDVTALAPMTLAQTATPTLKPGQTGAATLTLTNPNDLESPSGSTFVVKAPSGTTFAFNEVAWKHVNGNKATGVLTGTLSADKKTLTVDASGYIVDASIIREHTVQLTSDKGNTRTGAIADGSFEFTAGSAVTNGLKAAVSYTAEKADIVPVSLTSPAIGGTTQASNPVFTGKGHPGALIEVKGSTGRLIATATVTASGDWTATSTIALGDGRYVGTVNQTVDGNVSSVGFDYSIVKDVQIAPLTLTSPAIGGKTTDLFPTFTGKGHPGASIEVIGSTGRTVAKATVGADGKWTATSTIELYLGRFIGTVKQDAGGEISKVSFDYNIVKEATPVALTSPAIGGTVSELTPTFTGTGEPGAAIEVKGNSGKLIASATVGDDGTWTAVSTIELFEGRFIGTVNQDAGGMKSQTGFDYTIKK